MKKCQVYGIFIFLEPMAYFCIFTSVISFVLYPLFASGATGEKGRNFLQLPLCVTEHGIEPNFEANLKELEEISPTIRTWGASLRNCPGKI